MTLGKAIGAMVNEFFQVKAIHLLFWMRTVVLIVLLPMMLIYPPPTDWVFYAF